MRELLRVTLEGTGLNVMGAAPIAAYDARAPVALQSCSLMPSARGVLVVGSAGPELWHDFRAAIEAHPKRARVAHPFDEHVARALDRVDAALGRSGVQSRRFEPTLDASPALDFRALGEIAGLGSRGPFGMLIHETHGPWWALRGAWLVDVPTFDPAPHRPPCVGCAAPCVEGDTQPAAGVARATAEVRARCLIGQASRYEDDQVAYHYDPSATRLRLRTS